jgi:hypothetical protein
MNAIVQYAGSSSLSYDEIERLAVSVAKSGLFGMKTPDEAMTLMMIAQAEGRHPALAARDYDIIQKRPAKKAEAMMRDFLTGGGKVEWHALTDAMADATFSHPLGGVARISWDMERAKKAGLRDKDNYTKFPRQMLRSRVVSEGVRTVWPVATSGMYVPEELRDMPPPPFNGPTIEATTEASSAREAINEAVPMRAAAAATPRAPSVAAPRQTFDDPLLEPDGRKWLANLRAALEAATSREEVEAIGAHDTVGNAILNAPPAIKRDISTLLAQHYARLAEPEEGETTEEEEKFPGDLPDVEIAGAEKMAAG